VDFYKPINSPLLSENTYNICGLSIKSDIPIPQLPPADGKEPDYALKVLTTGSAPVCRWKLHFSLPNGKPWMSVGGRNADFHLRFSKLAHFSVSGSEKEICCYCKSDFPLESIVHLFLDMVVPLLLSQQDRMVLHAGAVMISGKIIAFLGETGQGKSSLTTSFGQKGFAVVTDDCLVIENKEGHPIGTPLYPGLRLWPEAVLALFGDDLSLPPVAHYTDKRRLGPEKGLLIFCPEPGPLDRIYVLSAQQEKKDNRTITIDSLSPRDAFMELVKHPYRLGLNPREKLRTEFQTLSRLVNSLTVCRIRYPRDYAALPDVHEAILADLNTEA
jgi:hypothetical protein